jgi:hypothetical protein
VRADVAADEGDGGEVAPRAAEVRLQLAGGGVAGQLAVEEDVAEGRFLRRAGSGDVATFLAVDVAAIEDGRCAAIDEIDAAFDVTVTVILALGVRQERVLPAEQAAVLDDGAVALDA